MAGPSHDLRADDTVYRVLRPEQYDESGPLVVGFDDCGKTRGGQTSDTLSFYVARFVRPALTLQMIAKARNVRDMCGTGRDAPDASLMYERGFRVAALPAHEILAACEAPGNPLEIETTAEGHQISEDGHLGIVRGDLLAGTWANVATILTASETLSR